MDEPPTRALRRLGARPVLRQHGPAITFECGEDDAHVPSDGALRFQTALRTAHPAAGDRVRVAVHPGVGHVDGPLKPELRHRYLTWLETGA
jgi:fermentation-respiration switch protein FrsA (DUF1100 family)